MELKRGFSRVVLSELILEAYEFGDLSDTRGNMLTHPDHLTPMGQIIRDELHSNGIRTEKDVDTFFSKYIKPLMDQTYGQYFG